MHFTCCIFSVSKVFSENKYGILSYKDGRLRKHLKVDIHDLQSGCACIVPKLKAQPFWNTAEFSWVTFLESQYDNILCEFQALRNENIFQVKIHKSDFYMTES